MGRQVHWAPTKAFFLTYEIERQKVKDKYGKTSWNYKLLKFIHSHGVQAVLAALLALDVLVLIAELIITGYYPSCSVILDSCLALNSSAAEDSATTTHATSLATEDTGQCEAECIEQPHGVHRAHEALFWMSICILIIFELELAALFAAIRQLFFRNVLYVFDFVVVTVALVLETVLRAELAQEAGGLLIFVRLWRLLRVGHGIFTDVHEIDHTKLEKLRDEHKELIKENDELRKQILALGGQPPTPFLADRSLSATNLQLIGRNKKLQPSTHENDFCDDAQRNNSDDFASDAQDGRGGGLDSSVPADANADFSANTTNSQTPVHGAYGSLANT